MLTSGMWGILSAGRFFSRRFLSNWQGLTSEVSVIGTNAYARAWGGRQGCRSSFGFLDESVLFCFIHYSPGGSSAQPGAINAPGQGQCQGPLQKVPKAPLLLDKGDSQVLPTMAPHNPGFTPGGQLPLPSPSSALHGHAEGPGREGARARLPLTLQPHALTRVASSVPGTGAVQNQGPQASLPTPEAQTPFVSSAALGF